MAGSKLYGVGKGRRKLISKSPFSARRNAAQLRVGVGSSKRGAFRTPTAAESKAWKPRRGRRKLGARRKLTVIETLFRWIKVPTGKVRRRSRRR